MVLKVIQGHLKVTKVTGHFKSSKNISVHFKVLRSFKGFKRSFYRFKGHLKVTKVKSKVRSLKGHFMVFRSFKVKNRSQFIFKVLKWSLKGHSRFKNHFKLKGHLKVIQGLK